MVDKYILISYYAKGISVFLILLLVGYVLYYIGYCIIDSSRGSISAPQILPDYTVKQSELLMQILYILGGIAMSFLPACVYYVSIFGFVRGFEFGMDWISVALAGLGVFFLPMSLLRAVLFASFEGLNPIAVIGSVFRTFRQYCFWVFIFLLYCSIFIGLIWALSEFSPFNFILTATEIYMLLVLGHILGRFYWLNKYKLGW
jgi:hypothetical protein